MTNLNPTSGNNPGLPKVTSAAQEKAHPVLSLPFVRDTTRAERQAGLPPRLFWSVCPTGSYTADCNTGSHFAQQALDYMMKYRAPCLMQTVVFDMMRPDSAIRAGSAKAGIEVGFLSFFGNQAMVAGLLMAELRKSLAP